MSAAGMFKKCNHCDKEWPNRDDFLADDSLSLIGYQPNFVVLSKGLFLFNHQCGNTLSLSVDKFSDLYQGPVFTSSHANSSECLGYCLHKNDLRPCPSECECSYVRHILSVLNKE